MRADTVESGIPQLRGGSHSPTARWNVVAGRNKRSPGWSYRLTAAGAHPTRRVEKLAQSPVVTQLPKP